MLFSAPYNNRLFFQNIAATKPRNLADELTFNWEGQATMSPSFDNWVDTETLPERTVSLGPDRAFWEELGNVLPFDAEEGSWNTVGRTGNISSEVLWDLTELQGAGARGGGGRAGRSAAQGLINDLGAQGVPRLGSVSGSNHSSQFTLDGVTFDNPSAGVTHRREVWGVNEEVIQERIVREQGLETETQQNALGERIVDVGLVPFMRQRDIEVTAFDLKGNTQYYIFFDGIDVTDNCTPSEIISDSDGNVAFTFTIPAETFNVGQRVLEIVDDEQNRPEFITSRAQAEYTSNGLSVQQEGTVISTEVPRIVDETRTESRTTDQLIGSVLRDPTSYSFYVEQDGGAFLSGVDLFFRTKHPTLGVTIEVRNLKNGVPGKVVVPFSRQRIPNSDIITSEDATSATEVRFENPIFLDDKTEYVITLIPEKASTDFELWVSELGGFDITTGARVVEQPGEGVVFSSSNNSTWSVHQQEDFKCNIYFAEFETGTTSNVTFTNADIDRLLVSDYTNGLPAFSEQIAGNVFLTLEGTEPVSNISVGSTVSIAGSDYEVLAVSGDVIEITYDSTVQVDDTVSFGSDTWTVTDTSQALGKVEKSELGELTLRDSNGLFDVGMTINAVSTGSQATIDEILDYTVNLFQPRVSELVFADTSTSWSVTLDSASGAITNTIQENRDFRPSRELRILSKSQEVQSNSGNKSLVLSCNFTTNNKNVSPIIDAEKISSIVVRYSINNEPTTDETTNNGENLSRYFTKPISLSLPAEDIVVFLDAKIPEGATVDVFYKIQNRDDPRDFGDLEWKRINGIVSNKNSFEEYFFTPVDDSDNRDPADRVLRYDYDGQFVRGFSKYAVKLVMRSANTSKFPVIKNLRAIALQI